MTAGHHHRHDSDRRSAQRAYGIALAVTFAYACVELAGGVWSGSLALVSDSGHMFSDALALGLAALASWLARKPAGFRHSYGWARAEVIGALLNGLLMLVIVVWLVVEAVQRLLHERFGIDHVTLQPEEHHGARHATVKIWPAGRRKP